jgi:hypothetical protein
MTDYTKSTGGSGTMMIRDTGSTVEFWINANNSTTFDYDLPWAYIVNGSSSSWQSFRYSANTGWQRLGAWTVTTNQTVTFKLNSTGTAGFGGPTTFSQAISRSTVPSAPSKPTLSAVTVDTVTVSWSAPNNGGSSILGYQLGYGTSSTTATTEVTATSPYVVKNLAMNTVYYFWVRARNANGWGGWSASSSAKTILGVYVNVNGVWKPAIPYVRTGGVWKQAQPYALKSPVLIGTPASPSGGGGVADPL